MIKNVDRKRTIESTPSTLIGKTKKQAMTFD
jgi:hypothetical protein